MANIFYTKDVDTNLIKSLKVAIVGYGSQGHAHALNLKDNGVNVRVALYEGSASKEKAEAEGLTVLSVADATKWADVLMFCTPDVPMAKIYGDSVAPNLRDGQTLMFAHGFNVHFGRITPPANVNVAMIAPKGPGHRLRAEFVGGNGMPALIATRCDRKRKSDCSQLWLGNWSGCGGNS
jgi:ketol-acid reductoisomerase